MLDAFKTLTGGSNKGQKQAEDLQALIAAAKEERGALSAMLTQISMRSSKLAQLGKSLEQVTEKATGASERLDELATRIDGIDDRTHAFAEVDKRVQGLLDAATQAQQAAERLMAPDGELQKHRQTVQSLSSQMLETQASIDTLKRERAALEDLRAQLRLSQNEVKQSVDAAAALKSELGEVRTVSHTLSQDYARLREMSREAREDSVRATEAVKEVEKKLGPLAALQEMSKSTEERLASLNALAEHVSQKAKTLESIIK